MLAQRAVKFLYLNFINISIFLFFLNYFLSLAKILSEKAWTFSIKKKFLSQKLYNTAKQNNSVINS